MIDKNELFDIRRRIKLLDDKSADFEDLYNSFSWFLNKFLEFTRKSKKSNVDTKITKLIDV